ncbi:hypothetical protein KP509_29G067700 [Ceratopteris richardii]|uniref:Alkaline phytoceramidase n=1 Tax=Ceratopteris richardii TaxID=49495 RepID=A0A8T2R8R9_CERRI|nr:hypothetical protein KP509_29G067700 [Ceratopteris richardii]KAH7292431.1 hypothetical protein KP509_29G067700 [Ceratopteris richardii]KAH7292432.1 hypothetical protein KP509_29G067700 [Ceratopteris richardii]
MADSAVVDGHWGPFRSTCENLYGVSPHIAEFYNTLSNLPGMLFALLIMVNSVRQRFEKRFGLLNFATIIVGIGSMFFHGTLQHFHQQSEEIPMVWLMLMYFYVLYSPDWHYRSTMPTVLCIYGFIFGIIHSQLRFLLTYQIHYFFLGLLCLPRIYKYYIYTTDQHAKRIAHIYMGTLLLACFGWVSNWAFCNKMLTWKINSYGHALWHFLVGLDYCFANTYLQFCRAEQLNWSPKLCYFWGLPYVKVIKPKEL